MGQEHVPGPKQGIWPMSHVLRGGITRLEMMTKFTLATLALASGIYAYLGVRSLLEGSPAAVFFAAVVYSAAVSVGIYAFWTYLMRFLSHVKQASSRRLLYVAMAIGSMMILAMSAWLNAAALAGAAALEQHMAMATEEWGAPFALQVLPRWCLPTPTVHPRARCGGVEREAGRKAWIGVHPDLYAAC